MRDFQFGDRFVVLPLGIQIIRQREVERSIIGSKLQGRAIFVRGFRQHAPLPVSCRPNQVYGLRIAHILFCQLHLPQGYLGSMQIKVGIGESQVCFAVVWFPLEGRFEIGRCGSRLVQVMQHVSAVDVRRNHIRIPVQRRSKILPRLIKLSVMLVHIAGQQRNVRLFSKSVAVLSGQLQEVVVALEDSADRSQDKPPHPCRPATP